MATPTLEIREELLDKLPPLWMGAPLADEMEKFAIPDHPLLQEAAPKTDEHEVGDQQSCPSIAGLVLDLMVLLGVSLRLTVSGLYDWLSGPPMTARQRDRLSISALDRYWKYRYFE